MDATLYVRLCKLNPTLPVSHAKEPEWGVTVKYPIRRVDMKSFSIPQGNAVLRHGQSVHWTDPQTTLFQGTISRRTLLDYISFKNIVLYKRCALITLYMYFHVLIHSVTSALVW